MTLQAGLQELAILVRPSTRERETQNTPSSTETEASNIQALPQILNAGVEMGFM